MSGVMPFNVINKPPSPNVFFDFVIALWNQIQPNRNLTIGFEWTDWVFPLICLKRHPLPNTPMWIKTFPIIFLFNYVHEPLLFLSHDQIKKTKWRSFF